LSASAAALVVGGSVFGISRTVVTPPSAAAAVPDSIVSLYAKKGSGGLAVHLAPGKRELRVGEGAQLTTVRYVGAGFLLTHRRVYEAVVHTFALPTCNTRFAAPVVPYFLPMVISDEVAPGGYWYLGEDYAFLERARQAGHATVVDPAIRLGHVGAYTYGLGGRCPEDNAGRRGRVHRRAHRGVNVHHTGRHASTSTSRAWACRRPSSQAVLAYEPAVPDGRRLARDRQT